MPEAQGPVQPQENPFRNLLPIEANKKMQEIFALVPVNANARVHLEDPTLAQKRADSELSTTAVTLLTSLMEVSRFTPSGQQKVVEEFQMGFMMGRNTPDARRVIPDNTWPEDFGWDDPSGGSFGEKAKDLEFKLYKDTLTLFLIANKSGKRIIEELKESTKPEEQGIRERLISQGMIDEALGGVPENPTVVTLRKWRSELIEKWNDEP